MASLAANIPQGSDPEYLRYSRPISGMEGNKAGAYIGKAIGEAVDIGAKTGTEVVGQMAENQAFKEGQAMNEQLDKIVDPLYRQIVKGENPNESSQQPMQFAENQPSSLIAQNKDLPPEIANGNRQASALNERFKNGKITETDYDSEIAKLAKNLNAKFPAFRNEISRGLSRSTGRDNANQSVADKIRDINTMLSQQGQQRDKVLNHIDSTPWGDPRTGVAVRQKFMKDNDADAAMFQVYRQKAVDANQERALRAHNINAAARTETEWKATESADQIAHSITDNFIHKSEIFAGAGTPAEYEEKLMKLVKNPSDPEAQQLLQQYALSIPMYRKELTSQFSKLPGLTPSQRAQLVDTYAKPFEDQIALMSDPTKAGSILFAQKHMADAMQRRQEGLISQDEFGQQLMGIKALQGMGLAPDVAYNMVASRPDFTDRANKLIQSFKYSALGTAPEAKNAPAVSEAIAKSFGLSPNPKVADDYINFLSNLRDIKDPNVARNVAYAYFNPKNMGMIGQWSRSTTDIKGNTYSGQINVLEKMSDKSLLDTIKKIGDPKLNGYVADFLKNAYTYNVFPGVMQNVESVAKSTDRLGYDDESQHFHLTPLPGRAKAASALEERTVNQLNKISDAMKNVADFEGVQDKNGYLIGLITAGNPNAFSREIPGFPGAINKAIQQKALQSKMEEEQKTQRKKELQAK